MTRGRLAVISAGLIACLASPRLVEGAGQYDPDIDYQQITTPHFYVVYPPGYEHIALRTGRIAEDLLPFQTERFGYTPSGRTTIIINDQNDFANGSATVSPNKVITILVTAPTEVSGLEEYDDWLRQVIDHELAHIIQLDMVFGLPIVGRWIFGQYVALNQYTPAWSTEGFAVYEETVSSATGRGRSSYADMIVRMAAIDDAFPSIDEGYRSYAFWPFANVAYMIGGRFQLWLAENYGEETLMRYHREYAAMPIPYFSWWPSLLAFDATLETLWMAYEREMIAEAELRLREVESSSIARTQPIRLTNYGGNLLGPRITPDGQHIIFSTSSPKDGPRVRRIRIDGSDDTALINDTFSKAISFAPDGRSFYFQQTEINQRFYQHNSILRYDVERDEVDRVELAEGVDEDFLAPSGSMRARDPDVSADGRSLVFVQTPFGANRLVLADLDDDGITVRPKVIVPAEPDVQLSNPRFSPDGTHIAVSQHKGGRRDVILVDRSGRLVRQVTADRAQDVDATWSPDGRWLIFSSDRTEIYNLYAYDPKTDRLYQITNLISGAYQPTISPDGQTLVFRGYSSEGFDVYKIPFRPDEWLEVELDRRPPVELDDHPRRWPPVRADSPEIPPPAPFKDVPVPETLPEGWSKSDYTSLDTFLPFQNNWNLLPEINADETELFIRLTHFGIDALNTQGYAIWGNYRTSTNFFGGGFSYFNDMLDPTFSVYGNADTRLFVLRDTAGNFLSNYTEIDFVGNFTISLPFNRRHLLSMGYTLENRDQLNEIDPSLIDQARALPATGRFARITMGYSYRNLRSFPHSISPERGWSGSLALSALSKGLGSDYEQMVASGDIRGYLSMPAQPSFFANQVLAARLSISAGWGPDKVELFRLGGVGGASALTTTTSNFFSLRGLPNSILVGTAVLAGAVEYRMPFWRIERGLGTLPFSLRVLHGAVFFDYGRVFEELNETTLEPSNFFSEFALSTGAEIRANILLSYTLELELRFGLAYLIRPPDSESRDVIDGTGAYFQIGSLF